MHEWQKRFDDVAAVPCFPSEFGDALELLGEKGALGRAAEGAFGNPDQEVENLGLFLTRSPAQDPAASLDELARVAARGQKIGALAGRYVDAFVEAADCDQRIEIA